MAALDGGDNDLPDGIFSLLDTDLYKLTMQCAILKYLPDVQLGNLSLSSEELQYLKNTCTYFNDSYLKFLSSFRFEPSKQIKTSFLASNNTDSPEDMGEVQLSVQGRWLDTILYEIPLLALTSEAYFKFCDKDWRYDGQKEKAHAKGTQLIRNGCNFSEFGSRRRRDYHTQDLVIQGLVIAADDAVGHSWKGKLSGTSNVHFAMKCGIPPIGTVAHEWFMGIASITNDYNRANETAMRYWVGCFGVGVLGIALTDTFGTPTFLKAFKRTMPTLARAEKDATSTRIPIASTLPESISASVANEPANAAKEKSYAQIFQGVRQDSGNPLEFVKLMRSFYDSEGITEKKAIVFSDSLNIELCLEYKKAAEEAGFLPTFGVGTFLTNDFVHISDGRKSAPLNIVIKLSSANGAPAIKISDNVGKNTGDSETVIKVKQSLGYVEETWRNGDETSRWGSEPKKATDATLRT